MTSVFDFLLMRRKVLLKDEWRKPWKPEPAAPKVSDPGMDKLSPAEKLFRSHQYYKAKWERERHLAMLQAAQKPKGPLNLKAEISFSSQSDETSSGPFARPEAALSAQSRSAPPKSRRR